MDTYEGYRFINGENTREVIACIRPVSSRSYDLVLLQRTMSTNEVFPFEVQTLTKPVEAPTKDTLPNSFLAQVQKHEETLVKRGYSCTGLVTVNQKTGSVTPLQNPESQCNNDQSSFHWLLSPNTNESAKLSLLSGYINILFRKAQSVFGFEMCRNNNSGHSLPQTLMRTSTGFEILVGDNHKPNTIHAVLLEGGGDVYGHHGHQPMLTLIYVQQRLRNDFVQGSPRFDIADESGQLLEYQNFASLEPIIDKFGFDYDQVRSDAEELGLTPRRINFSVIQTDIDDAFF